MIQNSKRDDNSNETVDDILRNANSMFERMNKHMNTMFEQDIKEFNVMQTIRNRGI